MNFRRDLPDELDRLLGQALHDAARHVQPPARLVQNVSAAIARPAGPAAVGAPPSAVHRFLLRLTALGPALGSIGRWLISDYQGGQRAVPVMVHNVGFADVGYGSPSMMWWNDVYDSARGQPDSIWQACAIAS